METNKPYSYTFTSSPLQRGYAAAKARNLPEAIRWFEKALAENPADPQAMALLGQSLCSAGQRQEGQARLRQAGRLLLETSRKNADIAKPLEIAVQLQHWADFHGALELIGQAVEVNDTDPRAYQLLAVTYAQLNRKAEALKAGERALQLAPGNAMMEVLQGSLEADAGMNAAARSRLEKVLDSQPGPREAFRAHKELARVLDKLGEFGDVFAHLHAAGSLAASLPEYRNQDAALIPNMLKANRTAYDRELLGRWSGTTFPQDPPAPAFIVGFMRSGTTLTQEVLDAHRDVFVADEADFVWAMQQELHRMDPARISVAEKLRKLDVSGIAHLRRHYWDRVRGRFGDSIDKRIFVDKFTMNTIDMGLINCVFPDAKVVFVLRDPRDVCLSCFLQLMVPTATTVHLLTWQGTASLYNQIMDWWMYIREQLTLGFLEFRYEDAIADFEPTFRKVFDFLGVDWDPAVVDFHKRAAQKVIATPSRTQVAQPLYSSSVARWRQFEPEFAPVMDRLRPAIRAFGYEDEA